LEAEMNSHSSEALDTAFVGGRVVRFQEYTDTAAFHKANH
jgi:hypothetical protein